VGLIAAECEHHDGLHVNDDHVIVEIVREDGTPAADGENGQVVVTDLINYGMPLIRYAVGDMSAWMEGRCACGRQMPRLRKVLGRTADFLKADDGKLVAGVSLVERTLTAIDGLEEMQIVQHALDRVTVRCVIAASSDREGVSAQLRAAMQEALNPTVWVNVDVVRTLSQESNGKYRFAICEC
jgi:phenylacetate-CoA ligase